jgi:hypothetical protein
MIATRYQHHNQESEADHTYFYDCVGFVSYAMSQAAPTASTTTRDTLKIKKGYVPSPASYVRLFGKVDAGTGLAGWAPVTSVAALQAGDVIAWYYDGGAASKPGSASGHAVVIAGPLSQTGSDAYSVLVYDSARHYRNTGEVRRSDLGRAMVGRWQRGEICPLRNGAARLVRDDRPMTGSAGQPSDQGMCIPEAARAMTSRWISEVPSKSV